MAQFDKHQLETSDQELFTDSFNFCWELLKSKEYYLSERETDIFSKMSLNYGQDMYDAMMIIINKIIKSNEHKSKVESTEIVTAEATCDSGYDDNCDQLDQQQKQQQVHKVNIDIDNSQNKMILEKRKISVDEVHSKKMFKEDNQKNCCDDSSITKNIQIVSLNENSIEKSHIIVFIKKEKKLFTKDSITIKDDIVSDELIDVNKMNNSNDHSYALDIKSNEISNFFEDHNQSCSNEVIGSLALTKYSFCAGKDHGLSFTTDENYLDDDDNVDDDDVDDDDVDDDDDVVDDDDDFHLYVDNDDDDNSLNHSKNREGKIKIINGISYDEKTRVVKLATENPNWSLDLLRERSGCGDIRHRRQVEVWKEHIERGGSLREKMNFVNNWVINKCIENQKKGEVITNAKIKTWGLEAKKIFKPKSFTASAVWLIKLKKNHEITGKPNNLKINCDMQKQKSFLYSNIYVPHEMKVKVVNLSNDNPHWSLKMLREQSGCNNLENMNQLYYWRKVVKNFNKKRATSLSISLMT